MVDKELKREAIGRTLRQSAQDENNTRLDKLELRLIRLYAQEYESINGKRIKLTDRRKIKKANDLIDAATDDPLDLSEDARNQIRLMDQD